MKQILIATQQPDRFSPLAGRVKAQSDYTIAWADTTQKLFDAVSATPPKLTIIDAHIDGKSGIALAREAIMKNAMADIAVVSSLSEEEFHEASEGLGIVAQLPPAPDETHAGRLIELLATLP
ncbi:MAG: hypothetical protein ACQERN_06600 [Thermodesulfobacteriota bacterium]